MTDEQIIKALECCHKFGDFGCGCCPLSDEMGCRDELKTSALFLINRQKAEIERLNKAIKGREQLVNTLNKCYKQAKSEAIKEFANRLKNSNGFYDSIRAIGNVDKMDCVVNCIDNLVKEMTEVQE